MVVTLAQMDIELGQTDVNIARADQLTTNIETDLLVLPEMWATGYSRYPEDFSEDESTSLALCWMKDIATKRGCAVCGSLPIMDASGKYFNRHYFVTPGDVKYYDKHHLFSYAHEDKGYTAGQKHVIVEWKGFRFLLQTCYDLRFPVWSRYGTAGEYDAIIYVANWPDTRQNAWDVLLQARAIENQCFVIGVNRVGVERKTHFAGGSVIIAPSGQMIEECGRGHSVCCHANIERGVVDKMRSEFPVLLDRD